MRKDPLKDDSQRPPELIALEAKLNALWDARIAAHNAAFELWLTARVNRCGTLTEEADLDAKRFIARYFMENGMPAPYKLLQPMVLEKVADLNALT